MNLPIVIPCYFYTEETAEAEKLADLLGKELDTDEHLMVQDVYFYSIVYVCEHPNNSSTMINAGTEDFRSPLPLDEIIALIR